MNGLNQYAPERGVGGFQEFASFPNTCANCWPLRSSTWRPLACRLGSVLEEAPWESQWVFVLVRCQHGRARGTKSRLRKLCPLAPLPGQSSTSPLGEVELWFGRGALCNAREAEIRTYGSSVCFSYTHIYLFTYQSRLRKLRARYD